MNRFQQLLSNHFLIAGVSSWLIAQVLKTIIHWLINRRLEIERLFGDGGMPSGHSATVTSLATMSALVCGPDSFEFAISAIVALVVCHDAMGVRRETGKQAVLINEMIRSFEVITSEKLPEIKLKELVGHTPLQVLAGILVGIVNACVVYNILF